MLRCILILACGFVAVLATAVPAYGNVHDFKLDKPPAGTFVIDNANIIDPSVESAINAIAAKSTEQEKTPIYVVTVERLLKYSDTTEVGPAARALYDRWNAGIGSEEDNRGALLLVSVGDQAAHIQLGNDFRHAYDAQLSQIMSTLVSQFRTAANDSQPILGAVQQLDATLSPQPPAAESPIKKWLIPGVIGVVAIVAIAALFWAVAPSGFLLSKDEEPSRDTDLYEDDTPGSWADDDSRSNEGGGASGHW